MEKKVEEYLIKKTKEAGGVCLKWQSMYSRMSLDRLLFLPGGRFAVVELKNGNKGRKQPAQPYMIRLLTGLGFKVYVVKTKEEIDNMINEVLNGN